MPLFGVARDGLSALGRPETAASLCKTSMPQTDRAEEQTRRVQTFVAFNLIEY